MRVSRRTSIAATALLLAAALAVAGGFAASNSRASGKATILAALISDVGKFNDKSFNQSQYEGLQRAKTTLAVNVLPLQSNSTSDYLPNLTNAVRRHADIVMAAGYLLAPALATVAKKFPDTKFAITDYSVHAAPLADKSGKPLFKNVVGLTYNANEGGCLAGVLAALTAKKDKAKAIGAVGGLKIPPVDIWIAGYKFCAEKAVPGIKVVVNYSQDFVSADKCKTVAANEISQGADVIYQVAGGCGLGVFKAADEAGKWAIGVDKDQYNEGKRVLTSTFKRVDNGIIATVKSVKDGKYKGGTDVNFNLGNGGIGLGRISPTVSKAFIAKANSFKAQIVAGKLKVPTSL